MTSSSLAGKKSGILGGKSVKSLKFYSHIDTYDFLSVLCLKTLLLIKCNGNV